MLREDVLATRDSDLIGTTLAAATGLLAGLAAGMLISSLAGNVDRDRVRRAVQRWRGGDRAARNQDELAREVRDLLRSSPETRAAKIGVHAVGAGLLELTGSAPDAEMRRTAGEMAQAYPGVDVVVNRILVPGTDLPPRPRAPTPTL